MARVFARAYRCPPGSSPEEMKRRLAAANPGCIVQALRAGAAENESVVEMLAAQTFLAEEAGSMLAKKPEIDLLLRVAGTTQISRAIDGFGAKRGSPFLLVVAGKTRPGGLPDLEGFELQRGKMTRGELALVERGALLSARRA